MRKKITKDMDEWKMMRRFWEILEEYFIPEATDEYWEGLIKAVSEFIVSYRGTECEEFADRLGEYLMDELNRRMHK